MAIRLEILVQCVDEDSQEVVSTHPVKEKRIQPVKSIIDLGFRHNEQIEMLQKVQDCLLKNQSNFLQDGIDNCPECGTTLQRHGFKKSDFHSVFTDHSVGVRRLKCGKCSWRSVPSVQSLLGTSVHPDLAKLQCELGAEHSYRDTQDIMDKKASVCRKINNHDRIRHILGSVGSTIAFQKKEGSSIPQPTSYAPELITQIDGGHVCDKSPGTRSFEALTSVIYRPENIIVNQKTGHAEIVNKSCAASALDDSQESIKILTLKAAQAQGLSKETTVTALCDGARNCWNVIDFLEAEAGKVIRILDWFHLSMKFENLSVSEENSLKIKRIKWHLWRGFPERAIRRLAELLAVSLLPKEKIKIQRLLTYVQNNKSYIVDYRERKKNGLIFTSQMAESTVESLINQRCKAKQHMSWTRTGLHSLLQIRASISGNDWLENWQEYILSALTAPKTA
jgi:hypothetical protein